MALWCRRLRGRVRSATGGWRRRRRRRPGWRVAPCRGDGRRRGAPGCSRSAPSGPTAAVPPNITPVRDCQPVLARPGHRLPGVAGPSPIPFVYVPGPTRKPRALLCVCCVKVATELDLAPPLFFCARGLPWEEVVGEALEGENLACGGRRWVAQSVGSAPEEGEGAGRGCNFPPSAGPCVTRTRGSLPPASLTSADRLNCASQGLAGLPLGDPSLALLQPPTLWRRVCSVLSAKGPQELWSARQVRCDPPSPARFSKAKPRGPRWTVRRLLVVPRLLEGMVTGLPIPRRSCLRAQRMVSCLPPLI